MPSAGGTSTVKAGATATYQLDVSAVGGTFSNTINLACEGVPAFATCSINPSSVIPGANTSSVTVTITTKATVAGLYEPAGTHVAFASLWMANGLGVFGVMLFSNRKSRRPWYILLGVALIMTMVLAGCAGSSSPTTPTPNPNPSAGTPAGNYMVIVVGTSGSAQHFSSLALTVQ